MALVYPRLAAVPPSVQEWEFPKTPERLVQRLVQGHRLRTLEAKADLEEIANIIKYDGFTQTMLCRVRPTMNTSASNMISEAAELGFEVRRPDGDTNHYVTTCRECHREVRHSYPLTLQPNVMATKTRNKGWQISRKEKPLCPACVQLDKATKTMNKAADHITWNTNPKIARKVYGLLDEHLNEETKLYRSGWNDAKIAKEIDVSVEVVLRIREEAYGKLAEDPAMQALRDDFEMLRMELIDFQDKTNHRIAEMVGKISDAEKRIPTRSVS